MHFNAVEFSIIWAHRILLDSYIKCSVILDVFHYLSLPTLTINTPMSYITC